MSKLVVVGLGYVGLPLVAEAVRAGLPVTGFDITPAVVDGLNAGRSHVDDLSDDEIADLVSRGFRATTDPASVAEADAVVICVPTPLSAEGGPDLAAVEGACRSIGPHLRPGTLVVLESTTYPGTTAEVVQPLLQELSGLGPDQLHVAYSPERIDPGNPTYGLKNTPKVVGADDRMLVLNQSFGGPSFPFSRFTHAFDDVAGGPLAHTLRQRLAVLRQEHAAIGF